jgi:hypothetical protein
MSGEDLARGAGIQKICGTVSANGHGGPKVGSYQGAGPAWPLPRDGFIINPKLVINPAPISTSGHFCPIISKMLLVSRLNKHASNWPYCEGKKIFVYGYMNAWQALQYEGPHWTKKIFLKMH